MRLVAKIGVMIMLGVVLYCYPQWTSFRGHKGDVTWCVFSPDARCFASGSTTDHTIRVWQVAPPREIMVLNQDKEQSSIVAFSSNGKYIAVGDSDGTVTVWNIPVAKAKSRFKTQSKSVRALALSPDGERLASASTDEVINVWNVKEETAIYHLASRQHYIDALAFSPDGQILASGDWLSSGNEVQLWNMKTGKLQMSLSKDNGHIRRLLFSPDGKTLCSVGSRDLSCWEVATGKEQPCESPDWLARGDYLDAVAFAPDSRTLAAGHESALGLWDIQTGRNIKSWASDDHKGLGGGTAPFSAKSSVRLPTTLAAAAFSSSGDLLILGMDSHDVILSRLTSAQMK